MFAQLVTVDVGSPQSIALPDDVGAIRLTAQAATVVVSVNIPKLHGNTFIQHTIGTTGVEFRHANGLGRLNLTSALSQSVGVMQIA